MDRTTTSNPTLTSPTAAAPPTTFVQADAHTFRDLVQRLTGATRTDPSDHLLPVTAPPRLGSAVGPRRPAFKLQKLEVKLGLSSLRSPRSPHHHHFHHSKSPIPSPVTPLGSDSLFSPASEEEKAIAEKGFYLHPSPLSTPRGSDPPELLPLFPLQSPKQKPTGSGHEC